VKQYLVRQAGNKNGREWAVLVPEDGGDSHIATSRKLATPTAFTALKAGTMVTGVLERVAPHADRTGKIDPKTQAVIQYGEAFVFYSE